MCWGGVDVRLGWRSWHQMGLWMPGRLGNPCHMEGTQPWSCPTELFTPILNPLAQPCPPHLQPALGNSAFIVLTVPSVLGFEEKNCGQEFL
ncbi:unnamed protein product [Gulo gulo]|uniref:Uncharacterized protein n=1 Tax=Gulo gulo TaxID=48420 RepID=A0A9X9Q1F3_GULGU|nr:unnamed protein product [Gulo gulo]